MTAAHLSARGVPSVLIDGSGRLGRGIAYSTREPVHVLNVVTTKMSAWPDHPDHFADWYGQGGTVFAERRAFGRYLGEQLAAAADVTEVEAMAISAERHGTGWKLQLSDGGVVEAEALVLAQGNQPPAPFPGSDNLPADRFINNPWSEAAAAAVAEAAATDADVLILGTGLTMVDTILSLVAAGHEGRITAVSRRGLIPRPHVDQPGPPAPVGIEDVPLGDLMALWRWLRARSAEVGYRAAVDSLRPHSARIWQALSHSDQRRFLRHARPWWDVNRHRIAPAVGAQLKDLVAAGRLEIVAGRTRMAEADNGLEVTIARRDGRESTRRVGFAFNCTGPLGNVGRSTDPLLRSLLDKGEVDVDALSIGLSVDEESRAGARIWALGPLTKGMYWEIVAVPDIRIQAATVADDIVKELAHHG